VGLRPVLDLDLLRTLVFIAEEASFTRTADRVGRTQSAVTLQVQKLETLVGRTLLIRSKGGPVELTAHGRLLVDRARKILALNDEAFRSLSDVEIPNTLRLGGAEYCASFYLRETLAAFEESQPDVLVEVISGRSCQLASRIKDDAFDLIVCEGGHEPRGWTAREVWRGPLRWITSEAAPVHLQDPLPLCLYPSDCPWRPAWMDDCYWRSAALRALQEANRNYRIVATTDSEAGIFAAVQEGKAVTAAIEARLPKGVRVVQPDEGLPPLPDTSIVIITGRRASQPLTALLSDTIAAHFRVS
jgi:DNA-binding transcriptional LysR family regulator